MLYYTELITYYSMKKITCLLVSYLLINSLYAQAFKGTIQMMESTGKTIRNTVWKTNGVDHVFTNDNIEGPDNKTYSASLLFKDMKAYYFGSNSTTYFMPDISQIAATNTLIWKGAKTILTGQTKQLAGHTCKEVIVMASTMRATCWVAEDVTNIALPKELNVNNPINVLSSNNIKGYPLQVTVQDPQGNTLSEQTILAIQPEEIPAATLRLPANYTPMEIPSK